MATGTVNRSVIMVVSPKQRRHKPPFDSIASLDESICKQTEKWKFSN